MSIAANSLQQALASVRTSPVSGIAVRNHECCRPLQMIYLLIGYMWLFIHRPFEIWPVLGTLRIERLYMCVTIAYWLISQKSLVSNRLNGAFLLLGAVILASYVMSPYAVYPNVTVENWLKIAVFYVIVMTSIDDERQLKMLVAGYVGVVGVYMTHSFREYLAGRHVYRMGVARMVGVDHSFGDPNTFSATVLYSLPMAYPLWYECHKRWHHLAVSGFAILAITCILLTGSRSAFVGTLFLCGVALCFSRHRARLLVAIVVAAPLAWNAIGSELSNRFLTLIDPSYGPANAQASAESREQGWRDGVRLWCSNPLLGVGPGVFGRATGSRIQSHHLYGQVLGELGTAGAVAFSAVLLSFFANWRLLRHRARDDRSLMTSFPGRLSAAVTVSIVLLLLLGFGGHNLYRYTWLWFGAFQAIALHCILRNSEDERTLYYQLNG